MDGPSGMSFSKDRVGMSVQGSVLETHAISYCPLRVIIIVIDDGESEWRPHR